MRGLSSLPMSNALEQLNLDEFSSAFVGYNSRMCLRLPAQPNAWNCKLLLVCVCVCVSSACGNVRCHSYGLVALARLCRACVV